MPDQDYDQPPTPDRRWVEVQVIAQVGRKFGVMTDKNGVLVITAADENGNWPPEATPADGKWLEILEGNSRYIVIAD